MRFQRANTRFVGLPDVRSLFQGFNQLTPYFTVPRQGFSVLPLI
jgi:hypothetical protein